MDDSGAVRISEAQQRLTEHGNRALCGQRSAAVNHLREGLTVDEFHYHHGVFVGGDERVESSEIGVVKVGLRLRFTPEARHQLGNASEIAVEHLDGNHAIERCVDSFIDDAHAALAELLDNAVIADLCSDHDFLT